jgi:hypothetical protein
MEAYSPVSYLVLTSQCERSSLPWTVSLGRAITSAIAGYVVADGRAEALVLAPNGSA